MIGKLTGTVDLITDKTLILDVHGVGYKIWCTTDLLSKSEVGKGFALWIHTVIREDVFDLYGFLERAELSLFEQLISVSGIGPRSALGILSIAPIETLRKAIGSGDITYMTKVSGIGKKTAEKIVLELRDKVGTENTFAHNTLSEETDVVEALKSLGYRDIEIREALRQVSTDANGTSARIKDALRILGGKA